MKQKLQLEFESEISTQNIEKLYTMLNKICTTLEDLDLSCVSVHNFNLDGFTKLRTLRLYCKADVDLNLNIPTLQEFSYRFILFDIILLGFSKLKKNS